MRELKAVGGDLRSLRLALTGAATGPELAAVLAALSRERGARARRERATERPEYDRPMRLYDTCTRGLVELPPPPGPIRMYVCGSTVYQRIHVGNSRPFVLGDVAPQLAAAHRATT